MAIGNTLPNGDGKGSSLCNLETHITANASTAVRIVRESVESEDTVFRRVRHDKTAAIPTAIGNTDDLRCDRIKIAAEAYIYRNASDRHSIGAIGKSCVHRRQRGIIHGIILHESIEGQRKRTSA
jgi:hypothetical protein